MILSRALLTYHLRQLRQSPATGVFLTVGWVAGVLLTFVSGQLFATNRAELTALFTYLPWVMAVLIPTLTMPVASEFRRGVMERLLTLPHTPTQRLFSRFAVLWGLLGVWLLGFWPLVATLYYLGNPDSGPIATGLLGSWLLAAPLLAISLTICLRARSGVGGLLASLATCLLLLLIGTAPVTAWFAAVPGLGWLPATAWLTLLGVYQSFISGLINLSAILLLTGLTLLILGASLASRNPARRATAPIITGAVVTLLALLPLFGNVQLDTTADKLHTPSPATITTLKNLPTPVTFTLYLSQNNPDVPPAVHAYAHSLTSLLKQLRAAVPHKVNVKLSNTDLSTNAAVAALQAGASEQSLPTGTTYFAALTANIGGTTQVIPAFQPSRQPVQEYDVLTLLTRAQNHTQPTIAILGNPQETVPLWQKALGDSFTLNIIPTALGVTEIPSDTAVLMLPDDAALPPQTIEAVRTYLAHGGNVVLATRTFTRAAQPEVLPTETRLSSILPEFGVQLVSETIIADPTQATLATQTGAGATAYPYWLQLTQKNLETTLPFTAGISKLFYPESGAFTLTSSNPLTLTPLITSSPNARAVPLSLFQSTPAELANTNLPEAAAPQILAVMASGAFGQQATRTANLVAFAGSDWLSNTSISQSAANNNDNLTLLTNLLHYLSGQAALTSLRAKNAAPRTLTRVEETANRLTQSTTLTEQKIATRLYEVTQKIATKPANSSDNLAAAQEEEFTLRQQLRDIRQQTRHHLQTLENALLLLNLALMPTLIGLLFFFQRRRQRLKATSTL